MGRDARGEPKKGRSKTKQATESTSAKTLPKVAEIYSRPRVTAYARTFIAQEIDAYNAYDIMTGYDFTSEQIRDMAKRKIDQNDIDVIKMCPPCTKFNSEQRSNDKNKRKRVVRRQKSAATILIISCFEIIKMQMAAGWNFIF